MATLVSKTVDPDGTGDYLSLSLCEASNYGASGADLTSVDEYVEVECISSSGSVDGSSVVMAGVTTDATRYVQIQSTGSNRHKGYWDDTKYRMDAYQPIQINTTEMHAKFYNLQFRISGPYRAVITAASSVNHRIYIDSCIFRGKGATEQSAIYNSTWSAHIYSSNCIAYDFDHDSLCKGIRAHSGRTIVYHWTMYGCSTGIDKLSGINNDVYARGNLIKGSSVYSYDESASTFEKASNNGCDDGSDPVNDSTPFDSSDVKFAPAHTGCYLLDPWDGDAALGAGSSLSADADYPITTDILGRTRSNWDAGAHEAATIVQKIIDTDSGATRDYASLSLAEAGEVTAGREDLVADNTAMEFLCRASSGAADITAVEWQSAWTTGPANRIRVWTDPTDIGTDGGGANYGSGATHRHDGKWNTSAYRLEVASGTALRLLNDTANFVEFIGIQLKGSPGAGHLSVFQFRSSTATGYCRVSQCIMKTTNAAAGVIDFVDVDAPSVADVHNCLAYYDSGTAPTAVTNILRVYSSTGTVNFRNCTVYGNTAGGSTCRGIHYGVAYNCLVQNCDDPFFNTTGGSYNCSDTGDAPGTSPINYTAAFEDAANEDFHLTATDITNLGGADLSAIFDVDIDNVVRTNWSTGADDDGSGGATPQILGGESTAATDATAALTLGKSLGADDATAATDATSSFTVGKQLSADAATAATDAIGAITLGKSLGADAATAATNADASLTVGNSLSTTPATAATNADAALTLGKLIGADDATAATDATGGLSIGSVLAADDATAGTDATGTLVAGGFTADPATAATNASGALTLGKSISTDAATAATNADGAITLGNVLQADDATASTDATGSLTIAGQIELNGVPATAATTAESLLRLGKVLAGIATAPANAGAGLLTGQILYGTVTVATNVADAELAGDVTYFPFYVDLGEAEVAISDVVAAPLSVLGVDSGTIEVVTTDD